MKYDIVIPLRPEESLWDDSFELKYLLRSIEKYFPFNRIIIVTDKLPDWIDNVIHVKASDTFRQNKDANLIRKLEAAIKSVPDLTETFYWSCDDHLVLRPPKPSELKPFFVSDLINEQSWWWKGVWKDGLKRTKEFLLSIGKTTYHYDVHIPQPINKNKYLNIFSGFKLEENNRYIINTMYFNQAGLKKHQHIGILKATIEKPINNAEDIKALCYNRLYAGYNNNGLTPELRSYIMNRFSDKSTFEK